LLARAGSESDDRRIVRHFDIARFRPDDPDALVHASLVCPFCLSSERTEWEVEGTFAGYDPSIRCECGPCQQQWTVYLAPEQALRLGLMHAHTS
jgi:hypothetical protein